MNGKNSRRQFLKGAAGGLGGIITAHIAGLFPEAQPVLAKSTARDVPISEQTRLLEVGELYAGFLLLPEQAPLPGFVRPSRNGAPNVCGIGAAQGGPVATAIVTMFATVADLNKAIEIPIYDAGYLPESAILQAAHSLRHENGELFTVSIDYATYNQMADSWETTIIITANPDFPRPFPLWSSHPIEENGPAVVLEKVNHLPSPGLMIATASGYACHWIQDDILYTLVAEGFMNRADFEHLSNSLTLLKK